MALRTTLLALATVAQLTLWPAAAWGQTVDPASQIVVIEKGDTTKITVKSDCLAVFTAQTSTPGKVTVEPVSDKPTKVRTIKVTATGNPGTAGSLSVKVVPIDAACGSTSNLQFGVFFVVAPEKLVKTFKTGDKKAQPPLLGAAGRHKLMRSEIKTIQAQHQTATKSVISQLKTGNVIIPPALPDGPGGELPPEHPGVQLAMTESERALAALSQLEAAALHRFEQAYWRALQGMSADAIKLLVQGGYQPTSAFSVPVGLQPGARGEWDRQRDAAHKTMQNAVRQLGAKSRGHEKALLMRAHKRGETLFLRASGLSIPVLGSGGSTPVTGSGFDETENMGIAYLSARSWNGPTNGGFDTSNGRIQVVARVKGTGAWFQVEPLDFFGNPTAEAMGGGLTVDQTTHHLVGYWPPIDDPPDLAPGTWRVTIIGPNSLLGVIDVVVPSR
jgi:hypothetical protein